MKTSENFNQSLPPTHRWFDDKDANASNANSEDCDYEDADACSPYEIENLFKHKYKIHDEPSVTKDDSYILSLAKDDSLQCIAAGLSDGSVRLFDISSEKGLYIKAPLANSSKLTICGTRFVDETPNLLLVGTSNGLVRLLDLRTRKEVTRFENIPKNKFDPKQIDSFDRNSNSRLLCMGTVKHSENVHLLFYDFRTSKKLYSYLDSHQDDVTSLHFHPQNPDLLCSGSTDGLINIYDVSVNDEDDAILTTINTESTVHKINWHKNTTYQNIVSCITHTNDFKTFNFDGDEIADFNRLTITETIKRKNEANCNLIDCHSTIDNGMLLLTGSSSDNGAILRSCKIQNDQILPYANLEGNKQIVRESIFDAKTNILITAGEGGFVTLWTPLAWETTPTNSTSSDFKMKTKTSNKFAPY